MKSGFLRGVMKKGSVVGLDIGTNSIKMAQFIKGEDGLHLLKVGLREISSHMDKPSWEREALSALKELLKGIDIKASEFMVSINCPKTCIRTITAPYIPKGELRDGIRLEAKSYFPFDIEESLLDFDILGEVAEKGVKKYELLVATSPKATVKAHMLLLEKAGIKPRSLIPVPVSLKNLIALHSPKAGEVKAVLELGNTFSEIAIFRGGRLALSRKLPVAGIDFTKAMTGALVTEKGRIQLSLDEAERIKRDVGIPAEGSSDIARDKVSPIQLLSMLRPPLERLTNEIERCFDYYREETGEEKIDSLILFGGGASLKGLAGYLSEELGMSVELGDPFEALKVSSGALSGRERASYRFASVIGAALNGAKGINLLPLEAKEATKQTVRRASIQAIAIAAILIPVLIYIGMRIQFANYHKRIAVAELELAALGPQIEDARARILALRLLDGEPYWEDVFKELSNIIPDSVYLTALKMKKRSITMEGIIRSEGANSVLSDFILALQNKMFGNVKLVTTNELKGKSAIRFELSCWVD